MKKINEDFNIPYYIFEEIVEYVELTAQGHCKCMKWDNIKSLLKLAQVNNRLTDTQVNYIIENFNREKKSE
ncbi:MAG: hypothetical protein ACI4UE_05090 [Candidatus Scatovivens sp.]